MVAAVGPWRKTSSSNTSRYAMASGRYDVTVVDTGRPTL
jgi:hypothetical protein